MLGLNPGGAERLVHDEIMTRWIYKTTDTIEEVITRENYFRFLLQGPTKIEVGDYVIIQSKPIDGSFGLIEAYVGYDEDNEKAFPIFIKSIDLLTGKVNLLSGLEDYIEEDETTEGE
jgi:hypothetical protein